MTVRRALALPAVILLCGLTIAPAARPDGEPLAGPDWITVAALDASRAQVDFASVWPRDHYVAYLLDDAAGQLRSERANGPIGNTSSHTWPDLAPCTTYRFSASAVVDGVETARSPQAELTTAGCAAGPDWAKVTSTGDFDAEFDFASIWPRDHYVAYLLDEDGVRLRRERANGPIGNTSSHSWRELAPCTTYRVTATAVVDGVETARSPQAKLTTSGCWSGFFNPGGLPAAGWRPYTPGSAWNRGTAGATVRPDSATLVDYLRRTANGRMQNIAVPDDTGSAPVYYADSDDPQYTIRCRQWISSCEVNGATARIPKGALPTRASDRHLVAIQPDGTEIDLWESDDPSGTGGELSVSHGGITRIDGDSTGSNAVAAMTGAMAGQFTSASWQADRINHALQLIIPRDNGRYVYPAGKTGASDPTSSPVPMGQWFKLDITDTQLAAEPPWRRAIYRAMRDYGLFVIDTGASFMIAHENPLTYTAFGAQDPARAWLQGQTDVTTWTDPTTGTPNQVAKTPTFPYDQLIALNPPTP